MTPAGSERADVLVVGGGLTGLSAAWALARRGREVLVLERAEVGHTGGGSHGSCRIFRFGYEDPDYVRLVGLARPLWQELEDASGSRLLHPCPQLTFGPQMEEVLAAMRQAGAPCELLAARDAADQFPGVAVKGDVVVYEPDSAVIAADQTLAALTALVQSAGGEVRADAAVSGLADEGQRVLVRTNSGSVLANLVIVCAGPWTPALLSSAGITVPGSATLEQVAYFAPSRTVQAGSFGGERRPIFVHYGGEFAYGLPVPGSDQYKLGVHHGGPATDPNHQDHSPSAGLADRIQHAAREFLPGYEPVPVAVERCVYDNSPDTDFLVDRIGNIVIGSGTSGHGFKFGPLLGEWLANLAVADDAEHAAAGVPPRFALTRF